MTTTIEIKGTVKDGFQRVKEAFAENFASHGEVGASLAVMIDGEIVVDIWGGYADAQRTESWESDTIANVFSTTKGMVAICVNRLIEQGKIDPEAPVATYWPEFAEGGKESLPVKYLLCHQAGLPAVANILPRETQYDWAPLVNALAAQAPWWEPGTKHGYHAVTFGHLNGELVRRVSGMSVGSYFRKEIAEPLGVDFHIGFGEEHDERVSPLIPAPLDGMSMDSPIAKAFLDPTSLTFKAFMITLEPMMNPGYMNTREWRAAEVPAANGHGNARALATIYGALGRGGELNGVQVLQRETIDEARKPMTSGEDAILMLPTTFGRGFLLEGEDYGLTPNASLFGHPGLGGSFGFADPDRKLGIGYVMNKMVLPENYMVDPRWATIFAALDASF